MFLWGGKMSKSFSVSVNSELADGRFTSGLGS